MSPHAFRLEPFDRRHLPAGLGVTGTILREEGTLRLEYRLEGPLEALRLPPPSARPARRDGLWQATCLEFFLGVPGRPEYWEFNLSPSGDWNAYRLADYRQGLEPETAITVLRPQTRRREATLRLDLVTPLDPIVPRDQPLEAAVTAVLEQEDGRLSYWALAHPADEPDFHLRAGFRLHL